MKEIDCRGLTCPTPVIMVKRTIESSNGESFKAILDIGAPRENVLRFCKSKGCEVSETALNGFAFLLISPSKAACPPVQTEAVSPSILISSNKLGEGSEELGRLLLKNFIITLTEMASPPEKIFLINSGVLLAAEGSDSIEPLMMLERAGIEILSCGVCLDYYKVKDKLAVGGVTTMYTITEALLKQNSGGITL